MKRKYIFLVLILMLCIYTSCKKTPPKSECEQNGHTWMEATCTSARTCSVCQKTDGSPLGHHWIDATCFSPKTCSICHTIEGTALDHLWVDATCTLSKHCTLCNTTDGLPLEHQYTEPTLDAPATCTMCGHTKGAPLSPIHYDLIIDYISLDETTMIWVDDYFEMDPFGITYSQEGIIQIDRFGTIQALEVGKTKVKFALKSNPLLYFEFDFEVIPKMPSIYVTYEKMTIGDSTHIYFKDKSMCIDDYDITFSNDSLVLKPDLSIEAVQYGSSIITITSKQDKRLTTNCTVSIVNKDSFLLLYAENKTETVPAGERFKMNNSLNIASDSLVWISSNKEVAVVSDRGVITTKSEGYTIISVYDKNNINDKSKKTNFYLDVSGSIEVDYLSRFIHTALEENGTKEVGNNIQKYGEWYPNNGQPWCAMFVSWCWNQAGLSTDILCKYQGCTAGMKWCTENGIMHYVQDFRFGEPLEQGASQNQYKEDYQPVTGDIVFFLSSGMSHTGICIYADDTYLYTIEGNTSDRVAIKRWSLQDARITGYAHPKYPEYSGIREDFSWIKELKSDGTYWWTNVSEQQKVD